MGRKPTYHANVLTEAEAAAEEEEEAAATEAEEEAAEEEEVVPVSNVVKRDTCLGNVLMVMPVMELQGMLNIFPFPVKVIWKVFNQTKLTLYQQRIRVSNAGQARGYLIPVFTF